LLEIAMLQGFSPDDIIDGNNKEVRRQIGNAVPVRPWMHHAKSLYRTLQDMDLEVEYPRCSQYDAQHTANLLKKARNFNSFQAASSGPSRRDRSSTRTLSPRPAPIHPVPQRYHAGHSNNAGAPAQNSFSASGRSSGKRRRNEDNPESVEHENLASDMDGLSVQPEDISRVPDHTKSSPQTQDKKRVRVGKQGVGSSVAGSSRQPSYITVQTAAPEIRFRKELIDLTEE